MSRMFRVVLVGVAGCGKGTVARRLQATFPDFAVFTAGDVVRWHIAQGSAEFLQRGDLVPEQLSSQLLLKELRALTRERRLILDGSFLSFHPQPTGFPRSESQAALLDANFPPHLVVELVVPEERILERLSKRLVHAASGRIYNEDYNPPKTPGIDDLTGEELSRRVDDEPSAVRRRLVVYRHTESRVADHYSRRGILVRAEGECTDSIWPIIRDSVHASLRKFNL